jgi:ribosomal protein L11 methyltransferase
VTNAQNAATFVARLTADEHPARRVANLLAESLDAGETACSAFAGPDGRWQVEIYFRERPDEAELRALVAVAGGETIADTLTIETVAARDWVKASLAGLKPVRAGRSVVHGSHDRAEVPATSIGIEIEAALAFGTGHHGTTRGCLAALDGVARMRRPRHVLDVGTGTGVLAIAAAKIWRVPVLATDIDPVSVRVARENMKANRLGALVETIHAAGVQDARIAARAPYDLVMANILLAPLQRLAAPMARQLSPNALVILSGLLPAHAQAAIAAYRSQGLALERVFPLDGWVTLVMSARSSWPRLMTR